MLREQASKSRREETSREGIRFKQSVSIGCGMDVHKKIVMASISRDGQEYEIREFKTFTSDLEEMKVWLKEAGVSHIAMESTGVYWKPIYNILEGGFEIILVNARHIKNVPGKKTDKKDSKWICKLLLSGLLKGSFIPRKGIRELRDLTRYRRKLIREKAGDKNRIQKVLEDGNIKLSSVLSNMSGVSATRLIEALIDGERDVNKLITLCHGKLRPKREEIKSALIGKLTSHHKFFLKTIKESMEGREEIINQLNKEIDKRLEEQELIIDIELLTTIPGVGRESAEEIIAEIGDDMSQFPTEKHIASWAGISPGNNESAGKKKAVGLHMEINI